MQLHIGAWGCHYWAALQTMCAVCVPVCSWFAASGVPCSGCPVSVCLTACLLPQGIFVDDEGMVAEGPNMNLGIITHNNELVVRHCRSTLLYFIVCLIVAVCLGDTTVAAWPCTHHTQQPNPSPTCISFLQRSNSGQFRHFLSLCCLSGTTI